MPKVKSVYVCQECGSSAPRWMGQCASCKAWNSLVEERPASFPERRLVFPSADHTGSIEPVALPDVDYSAASRFQTGVSEIDRVLGGGLVPGSAVLLAGNPGIGKSTLMTELGLYLNDRSILYIAGEESPAQIKLRASRVGLSGDHVKLYAETRTEAIIETVLDEPPEILVVDSIQTLFRADVQSAPGSVSQVREAAAALIQLAKSSNICILLVGHVTKDGVIAGPRVLEHMVDTVLYLEGDRHHAYRILRTVKNRFGSTNEIGVFEMTETGLSSVDNPSRIFLSERSSNTSGSAVVCSMEGTRPILAEVQALVTPTSYATPQRTATGYDQRRLQMLLAVMEKRLGLKLSSTDVFLNVTGGLRLSEPAIDAGIVAAVASSFKDQPLDRKTVVVGEVGLGGELRSVAHLAPRIHESANLGFSDMVLPKTKKEMNGPKSAISVHGVETIQELMEHLF